MRSKSKITGLFLVLICLAFLSPPPTTTTEHYSGAKQTKNNLITTNPGVTTHYQRHDSPIPEANSDHFRVMDCGTNNANYGSMVNLRSAIFLHIGKAGGGTIFKERLPAWQVSVQRCHPGPCRPPKHKQERKKNDTKLFLINVRDPVDRFESAFYFVKSLYCHLDPHKETRVDPDKEIQNPEQNKTTRKRVGVLSDQQLAFTCKDWPKKRSVKAYYVKYKENINLLAEALCSNNAITRMEAQKDLYDFDHLRASLDKWMEVLYSWPEIHNDNVFPIVMMPPPTIDNNNNNNNNNYSSKNDNLEPQVDQAVEWLYNKLHFESPQDFQSRQRAVQCQRYDTPTTKQTFRHSSKNANNPVLSEKGKACLAEFYRKDYKWLDYIRKQLCKTVDCEQAVNVILKNRATWDNKNGE